jgi:dethiobiotin synthetase
MQQTDHFDIHAWKTLFVTGTDTGVGKTCVSAAIACVAAEAQLPWAYYKPAESSMTAGDCARVKAWTGEPSRVHAGYLFKKPFAPLFAAEEEGQAIDLSALDDTVTRLAAEAKPLIVEGAGGLLVPYTDTALAVDLAARWRMPVLLVVGNRLGCLNHTLLTLEALAQRNLPVVGCVFNDVGNDPSVERNPLNFQRLSTVPLIAWLPTRQAGETPSARWWREGVQRATATRAARQ